MCSTTSPLPSELTTEAEPRFPTGFACRRPRRVAPAELNKSLEHALVIDLDTSLRYRDGHVPGRLVRRARRSRARPSPRCWPSNRGSRAIVLVSPDGEIAALAAPKPRRPPAACRSRFWQAA